MPRSDYNFYHPFRVRYAETDAQGIVFNAHYFTYFDTALYEYLRWLPFNYQQHVKSSGEDFHTVRVEIDFLGPSGFDDLILVHVRTQRIGRSSLVFALEIFSEKGEDSLVNGQVVWVNADQAHKKSAPLPKQLIERIKARESL